MSKYTFERLNPLQFEAMVKALIDDRYRTCGGLVQFGPGPDGAREATWTQESTHALYQRPPRAKNGTPRKWVFQVKYHDFSGGRARVATAQLVEDLDAELTKLIKRYRTTFHSFVLVTNASLTGVHATGGRDRLEKRVKKWKQQVPQIEVWDAADLSAMIDAAPAVRTTYLDQVLPGDVLAALLANTVRAQTRQVGALRAYLSKAIQLAGAARTDEAGDEHERQLKLEHVYIDLAVEPRRNPSRSDAQTPDFSDGDQDAEAKCHSASQALLLGSGPVTLLQAGPGYGKSTIAQFLTVWHAARCIDPVKARQLSARMELGSTKTYERLDALCRPRIPFRVELRRYAEYRGSRDDGIATYIAEQLINPNADASYSKDDVYELVSSDPCLVILDGLDEVPNAVLRTTIVEDAATLLRRCQAIPDADVVMVVSTRPQGYHGEFDALAECQFTIRDLTPTQFQRYRDDWLQQRIPDIQERRDALARVEQGMSSPEVARMATTLLQATVILTIARNKHDIPHERSSLFQRYVEVIFQRETNKNPLVKRFESELRRLHECVAYSLHCAMERGGSGSMGEEEFRNHVMRVWETYRGTEPLEAGLRPVVGQMIEAAKDRLVFLRGEGPEQSEIGFLLSSFREFFAACFLNGHEEADRSKVFEALFAREWHWENVLQFYAGLQETADQKSWLTHVAETDYPSEGERLFETVRFRRALLKLIPEFRNLAYRTFTAAMEEVFDGETLWAWRDASWAGPIVRAARGGTGLDFIVRRLIESLDGPPATREAAIHLACHVLRPGTPHATAFQERLAIVCADERMRRIACQAAVENDYPIAMPSDEWEAWMWALENAEHRPPLRRCLSSIPARVVAHCYIRRLWPATALLESHSAMASLREVPRFGGVWGGRPGGISMGVAFHPFVLQPLRSADWAKSVSESASLPQDMARYFRAIRVAMSRPGDAEAYSAAVAAGTTACVADGWLSVRTCLGPAPSEFETLEEWVRFSAAMDTLRSREEAQRSLHEAISRDPPDERMLALAVHPNAWPEFVRAGVVPGSAIDELSRSPLAGLLGAGSRGIDVGSFVAVHSAPGRDQVWQVDLGRVVDAAVGAVRRWGPRVLSPADLRGIITVAKLQVHGKRGLALDGLELLTEAHWKEIALLYATLCDELEPAVVERFWAGHFAQEPPYQSRLKTLAEEEWFARRMCESGHSVPFKLWVQAWLSLPYRGRAAEELASNATSTALGGNPAVRNCCLRALLTLPWTDGETQMWKSLNRSDDYVTLPLSTIRSAAFRIVGSDRDLSSGVGADVARRIVLDAAEMPSQCGLNAVRRLAALAKVTVPKLDDKDWQTVGKRNGARKQAPAWR